MMIHNPFLEQINELILANGWEGQLLVELIDSSQIVRIRLNSSHPIAPLEIINDYQEGVHPLEQVQQECLRALRTGSAGL
jgi:hypothetical protein